MIKAGRLISKPSRTFYIVYDVINFGLDYNYLLNSFQMDRRLQNSFKKALDKIVSPLEYLDLSSIGENKRNA